MKTIFYMFLLVFSLFLSGCRRDRKAHEDKAPEKEVFRMIQIHNLKVTKETLMLDYQVTNPFNYDIWICEDIDIFGELNVETRIDVEKLQIKCRFNLENNILLDEAILAKYHFLSPKECFSGKILLKLPVRNTSPVYDFDEYGKKRKQVVLHKVVFEVGYFEGNLPGMLYESIEKGKRNPDNEELYVEALYLESILKGRELDYSNDVFYIPHLWRGLHKEKSAKVIVNDIDIPCSVAIDEAIAGQ